MFRTFPLSIIRSFSLYTQQWYMSYRFADSCQQHVEFYSKNKFEKLVHLVGFIIRIYHDARSPERQIVVLTCMRASNSHFSEWNFFCHLTYSFQEIVNQTIIFSVGCSQDIRNLTTSATMTFRPSVKVSCMDLYSKFYDRRQGLQMQPLYYVVILMFTARN